MSRQSTSVVSQLARSGYAWMGRSPVHTAVARSFANIEPLIADGSLLPKFTTAAERWRDDFGELHKEGAFPELRVRPAHDRRGRKTVIQVAEGFSSLLTDEHYAELPSMTTFFSLLESVVKFERRELLRALDLRDAGELRVSVRVVSYRQGIHAPQDWHFDPSIVTRIHRPSGDTALVVRTRPDRPMDTPTVILPSMPRPSTVMIAGQCITGQLAYTVPAEHAVLELRPGASRLVVTSFLWPPATSQVGALC